MAAIVDGQFEGGSSKRSERLQDASRILRIGTNPDIEIAGGSDVSVDRKSVSSNDQELNVVRVEFGKQISEVLVHQSRAIRGTAWSAPRLH